MKKTTAFFYIAATGAIISVFSVSSAVYPSDFSSCLRLTLSSNKQTFHKRFTTLASAQLAQPLSPENVVVIPSVNGEKGTFIARRNMKALLQKISTSTKTIVIVCFDTIEKKTLETMFFHETKKGLDDFENVYIKVYGEKEFAYAKKQTLERQFKRLINLDEGQADNPLGAFTLSALKDDDDNARLYSALAEGLPLASNSTSFFSVADFSEIYSSMSERVMRSCGYEDRPEAFVTYVKRLALLNMFEYQSISEALTKSDFWETLLRQEGLSAVKDTLMFLAAHKETLMMVPEELRPFAAQVIQTLRQYYFTPRISLNDRQDAAKNKENKTLFIWGADVRTEAIASRLMSAKDKRVIIIARDEAEKTRLEALFGFEGENAQGQGVPPNIVSGALFSQEALSAIEKAFMWYAPMIDGTLPEYVRAFPLDSLHDQTLPGHKAFARVLSYADQSAQKTITMSDHTEWQRLFFAQAESRLIGPLSSEVLPAIIHRTLKYAAENNDRTIFVVDDTKIEEILKIVKNNETQAIEVITQTNKDQRDEEARQMRPKERRIEKIFLNASEALARPEAFTGLMKNAPNYIIPVIVGTPEELKKIAQMRARISKSFLTMTFDEAGVDAAFFADIAGDFTIGEHLGEQIRFLTPEALLKHHRGRASNLM